MKTQQLSPGRFSWRKYPEQINLELVRVRLSEAKNEPQGALIRGSTPKGWTLSAKGLEWALKASADPNLLDADKQGGRERGGSVDAQRSDRERARIIACSAWEKWPDRASEISTKDAQEVFRLDSYATDDLRAAKVDRLRKIFVGDAAILRFIDHLQTLQVGKP